MGETVLIVGAGTGLSASLARLCASQGMQVALAARTTGKLQSIADETGARLYQCDASQRDEVTRLFDQIDVDSGTPDMVVYNPSARIRGPIATLDPDAVKTALEVTCYGAFLVAQQATQRMLKRGSGSILFTGASAGVKGFANSAVFAMGKFGLRGLAQSMARELHPQNIHIGHFVIDGGIANAARPERVDDGTDKMMSPEAIAETYLQFHRQHRSAWAWEIELRPWQERF